MHQRSLSHLAPALSLSAEPLWGSFTGVGLSVGPVLNPCRKLGNLSALAPMRF